MENMMGKKQAKEYYRELLIKHLLNNGVCFQFAEIVQCVYGRTLDEYINTYAISIQQRYQRGYSQLIRFAPYQKIIAIIIYSNGFNTRVDTKLTSGIDWKRIDWEWQMLVKRKQKNLKIKLNGK